MILYLAILNALGLALMFLDKRFAVHHKRRIPEATLMLCAALGGSVGALLGMLIFRHKTRKSKFTVGIPAILIAQVAAWYLFFR